MVASKKKSTKKAAAKKSKPAPKASWADTMKKALQNKQPAGGWPDQGKPRDSTVKKLPTNSF